jgi:hypothetical protein
MIIRHRPQGVELALGSRERARLLLRLQAPCRSARCQSRQRRAQLGALRFMLGDSFAQCTQSDGFRRRRIHRVGMFQPTAHRARHFRPEEFTQANCGILHRGLRLLVRRTGGQ